MIPILLVDDDIDMLDLMNLAFKENGRYEVTACLDAREAVEVLKKRPIEVVISDYRMPVMNGGEFVKAARETGYKGLFVIYSGRGKGSPDRSGPSRWCGCLHPEVRRFQKRVYLHQNLHQHAYRLGLFLLSLTQTSEIIVNPVSDPDSSDTRGIRIKTNVL